ncbi:hypothetical protein [Demequina sp. NBRC 110057]|uniref:hypothetical protein n=1 Tax=Demequina sp. NBRC 110057 TaxID=1570346 RepID=UPI001178A5A7|nr:hypothetical protein [Demequina sp. NBRC 110057]
MTGCELCELQTHLKSRGEDIDLGDGWRVNVFQGTSARPRFVMQPEVHAESLHTLGPRRLASMGRLMGRVERSLLERPGIERVYFQIFSETPPGHPHIHVVPRFRGESELGPHLVDAMPTGHHLDVNAALAGMSRRPHTYRAAPLVSRILGAVDAWNSRLSPSRIVRRFERPAGRVDDFATTYVALSLAMLGAFAVALSFPLPEGIHGALAVVGAAWAWWRFVDIAAFVVGFVLGAGRDRLQHAARSLVMFCANATEVMLIGVVGLIALGASAGDAWVTVLASIAPLDAAVLTWPQTVWVVAVATVGIVVLTAVIGLIVGKLGERFVDEDTLHDTDALAGNKDH